MNPMVCCVRHCKIFPDIKMYYSNFKSGLLILILLMTIIGLSKPSATEIIQNSLKTNSANVVVGAERFDIYLPWINDKNIALMVNQTSLVKDKHLVDALIEQKVAIEMIFSPEHGFRGDHGAGEKVLDGIDSKTGIKLLSLYGKQKKPTAKQLKKIDVMLFDIQDVGVRFYTYISSMHYLMEACAENNIPLIVLDRPNPNGDYVDGPMLDLNYQSFVGMHPIPLVHGLTVGELAKMINGERWLKNGAQCQLMVVPVLNYNHQTTYSLPVKPSPNLPNDLAVRLYPSLALFEATDVSVGRGTDYPFQMLGYPDKSFGDFVFKPHSITGSWSRLNYAGESLYGIRFNNEDSSPFTLKYFLEWNHKFGNNNKHLISRPDFFDKLAGSDKLRKQILAGESIDAIRKSWHKGLQQYLSMRKAYLLYPE